MLVQTVTSNTTAFVSCATLLPLDDTIPQITEGNEVLTLAITPTSATNRLVIRFTTSGAQASAASATSCALFQDATVNALAAAQFSGNSAAGSVRFCGVLEHSMIAGTTSSTTFRIRVGPAVNAQNVTLNGVGGAREFGGVSSTRLVIEEITV